MLTYRILSLIEEELEQVEWVAISRALFFSAHEWISTSRAISQELLLSNWLKLWRPHAFIGWSSIWSFSSFFLYVRLFTLRWSDNKCLWISLFSTSRFLFFVPVWPTTRIQSLSNILLHTLSLATPWLMVIYCYRTGLKWELFLALLFLSAHKKEMMKAQLGRMRLDGPWHITM